MSNEPLTLSTERLELLALTGESAKLAIGKPTELAQHINAEVPSDWPPEHIDDNSIAYIAGKLDDPASAGWWLWFVIACETTTQGSGQPKRTLVGTAGYKGPVDASGMVEVGYSIVPSQQLKGYATEATSKLIDRAWEHPDVRQIVGETLPDLLPSIRVMEKLNFHLIGKGSEPGVIRYALERA